MPEPLDKTAGQGKDFESASKYADLTQADEPGTYVKDSPEAQAMANAGKGIEDKIADRHIEMAEEKNQPMKVLLPDGTSARMPTSESMQLAKEQKSDRGEANYAEGKAQLLFKEIQEDQVKLDRLQQHIAQKQMRLDEMSTNQ